MTTNGNTPSIFATPKAERQKFTYNDLVGRVAEHDDIIKSLIADRKKDAACLQSLHKRILKLEHDQIQLQSILFIKDRVTELLSTRVSNNEQYQRRPSLIVKGIDVKPKENLREEVETLLGENKCATSYADIDKYHRNGKREGNKQDIIIRFKWHSAKEDFFKHRKSIPRVNSGQIKIQPHLNSEKKKLLAESKDTIKWYLHSEKNYPNPPQFILPDVHGNLMVKMQKKTKEGLFIHFDSITELNKIIANNNGLVHLDASNEYNKLMAKFEDIKVGEEEGDDEV